MAEEVKQEEVAEEVKQEEAPQVYELLKNLPNGPTSEQIEKWKAIHGEVYVSGFSETELFVWRPLGRLEHVNMQQLIQDPKNEIDKFRLEEMICDTCVLYKSVQVTWADGKAGTPGTLSEQIMQNSNFVSPQQANLLVARL